MIDYNKKVSPAVGRSSLHQDVRKTPPIKKKITKENKKFLKLLKVLK